MRISIPKAHVAQLSYGVCASSRVRTMDTDTEVKIVVFKKNFGNSWNRYYIFLLKVYLSPT